MRILITGAFGQLGHALQSILSKKSNYELIYSDKPITFIGDSGSILQESFYEKASKIDGVISL